MPAVRPYRPEDLTALYRVCLATADAGADGAGLYRDPNIVGHVCAAPYAVMAPQSVFVAEDESGVAGYVVGVADTRAYEAQAESEWWPRLRAIYSDPREVGNADDRMAHLIHHPEKTLPRLYEHYPAHLHINLLPRLRRQGMGTQLMDAWIAAMRAQGARGAHLAVGARNEGAVAFYRRYGFRELSRDKKGSVIIFVIETRTRR